jgi:thiamine biosynthesis lipoprotein
VRTYHVEFPAIGTTASVVASSASDLVRAREVLEAQLALIDRACSRFRADSEIMVLAGAGGRPVVVSDTLAEAVAVALKVARMTDGKVDPTVGNALVELGYDRDFAALRASPSNRVPRTHPAPGWHCVDLDEDANTVRVPSGLVLDLGSSAKALVVDKAAAAAAAVCDGGVLVNVGGDIAVAGPVPSGGWSILVTDSHRTPLDGPGQRVAVHDGGLATSSTTIRRWRQGDEDVHHIVDPATGRPAPEVWRTVSVAAACCVDANAASTAAVLLGEPAVAWLARHKLPARLVRAGGDVVTVAGWPEDVDASLVSSADAADTTIALDEGAGTGEPER